MRRFIYEGDVLSAMKMLRLRELFWGGLDLGLLGKDFPQLFQCFSSLHRTLNILNSFSERESNECGY